MRKIKFRGKRVDNGEWVYGAFVPDALETPDNDLITWGFMRRYNRDIGKMETIEVARESVGQYTGLCDKNGQEIYEGDIVNYRAFAGYDYRGTVRFGEHEQDGSGDEYSPSMCLGFYVERQLWIPQEWQDQDDEEWTMPKHEKTMSLLTCNELEVIGNVHDDPDLLTGGKE